MYRLFDPDRIPTLASTEGCQIWRIPLTQPSLEPFLDHLTDEERERAERYKLLSVQRQFVVGRACLRRLLATNLGIPPRQVEITSGPVGKPRLRCNSFHFNVSHSGDFGLIALSPMRVGIDIEQVRTVTNAAGLVQRFFAVEECEQYQRLPEELRGESFLRGWTCKEALLKAIGAGLPDVQCCWIELDPRQRPRVHRFTHTENDTDDWQLHTWTPWAGYTAAIAVESKTDLVLEQYEA